MQTWEMYVVVQTFCLHHLVWKFRWNVVEIFSILCILWFKRWDSKQAPSCCFSLLWKAIQSDTRRVEKSCFGALKSALIECKSSLGEPPGALEIAPRGLSCKEPAGDYSLVYLSTVFIILIITTVFLAQSGAQGVDISVCPSLPL